MKLAVELSNDYIDLVEYDGKTNIKISKSVRSEMPEGAFTNGIVTNTTQVAEKIKELMQEEHIRTKKAELCVSGIDVITREIKIPACAKRQERELIKNELLRSDALRNGYLFDYLPGEPAEDNLYHYNVYLLPVELVRNYSQTMKRAGLILERIEPVNHSMEKLAKMLKLQKKENLTLLVDAGKHFIDVLLTGPGIKDVYRNIQVKKDNIEENVFIVSAIASATAERDNAEVILDRVVETVSKLIQFQYQASRQSQVDQILLYGGMAAEPGFAENVEQRTGIATRLCKVPEACVQMHSVENLYEELSFAALGVAGDKVAGLKRDISFVCYLDEESHIKLRDCIPVIAGIAIFIALAACYAATALENRRLINENNSLTAKIAAIEASEEYQRKASMQEDLILLTAYNENCEVCIQTLEATKRFSSEEFITVDELAPAGIKITGHEMDENRIRFYCMAGDANGPAEFAQIVAQTDIFENVEYTGFTAYSDMDGTIGYSFLLECSRKEELP